MRRKFLCAPHLVVPNGSTSCIINCVISQPGSRRWYNPQSLVRFYQFCLFKRFYLFIFRERGREGEREGEINVWETHQSIASHWPPTRTRDMARSPGMCPDTELNCDLLVHRPHPSTEPHQPGGKHFPEKLFDYLYIECVNIWSPSTMLAFGETKVAALKQLSHDRLLWGKWT